MANKYQMLEEFHSTAIKILKGDGLALAYNNRGHAKYMQVEFDGAVDDFTKSLQINPKLSVAYYNRGTVYFRLGKFVEALADVQKAVEMDTANEEYVNALTDIKLELERKNSAPR